MLHCAVTCVLSKHAYLILYRQGLVQAFLHRRLVRGLCGLADAFAAFQQLSRFSCLQQMQQFCAEFAASLGALLRCIAQELHLCVPSASAAMPTRLPVCYLASQVDLLTRTGCRSSVCGLLTLRVCHEQSIEPRRARVSQTNLPRCQLDRRCDRAGFCGRPNALAPDQMVFLPLTFHAADGGLCHKP